MVKNFFAVIEMTFTGLIEKELQHLQRIKEIYYRTQDVGLGIYPKYDSSKLEFIFGVSYNYFKFKTICMI